MQTTSRTESSNPSVSTLYVDNAVVRNQASFGIGRMDSELEINDQDNTQTPNSPSTDCGSSILTFILNIPKEIMNFFAGIIHYLTSFCSSSTENLPPALDMSAIQTFVNTQYQGTKSEQRAAFMQGFNALPEEAKEIAYLVASTQIKWTKARVDLSTMLGHPVDPTSADALPVLHEKVASLMNDMKLLIQIWILERERSGVPRTLASEQYEIAAAQAFIQTPLVGSKEEKKTAFLNGFNALPQRVKESVNILSIFFILTEDRHFDTNTVNRVNLKEVIEQAAVLNDPEASERIQDKIQNGMKDATQLIQSWINEKKRAITARNQIASVSTV